MALWAQSQQLTGSLRQQVNDLYNTEQLPYEVRHSIAPWLEAQPWTEICNTGDNARAAYLVGMMVQQIKEQTTNDVYNSLESFPFKLRLQNSANIIELLYTDTPLELAGLVSSCLWQEAQLVRLSTGQTEAAAAAATAAHSQELVTSHSEHTITSELSQLKSLLHGVSREVNAHKELQESLVLQTQESNSLKESINYFETNNDQLRVGQLRGDLDRVNNDLANRSANLMHSGNVILEKLKGILQQFATTSRRVLEDDLYSWRDSQRRSAYPVVFTGPHHINKIQKWCEDLGCLLHDCQQQIMKLEMAMEEFNSDRTMLDHIKEDVNRHLRYVLQRSLVVDQQPPQVVKKNTRFSAAVRLLFGNQSNLSLNMPKVKASIINELQARKLVQEQCPPALIGKSGSIINNEGSMAELQGQFGAVFRNMKLTNINRSDKKGLVTEEKFCILFHTKLQVGQLQHDIWTLSLPLVVTVHGNQDCQAQATILWDNAFSPLCRIPFVVPEQVTWNDLSQVLSQWFGRKTGSPLSHEHLQYLAARLFGDNQVDLSTSLVSRATFCKDQLQMKFAFTFWEWIFAIPKIIKDSLREFWNQGLIMGFVSKRRARDLLLSQRPGTFLLRFSEAQLGGISMVYSCTNEFGNGAIYIYNVEPLTDEDLQIRSLANRIKDLEELKYLYPDIPKERAFGQYWSPDLYPLEFPPYSDEYIKCTMCVKISGLKKMVILGHETLPIN